MDLMHPLQLARYHAQAGDTVLAERYYLQLLDAEPGHVVARQELGNLYLTVGRSADAATCYEEVTRIDANHADAWCNWGMALAEQGRADEALAKYDEAIRRRPEQVEAFYNRGNALKELERFDEAVTSYADALRQRPDFAEAHTNIGMIHASQGKLDDAIASYRRALEVRPEYALAANNLGLALQYQGKLDEAMAHFDYAIQVQPDLAAAHSNRAQLRLLRGDFLNGWQEYEWRWRLSNVWLPPLQIPLWDGTSLDGKSILLRTEQGFGDSIQFVRYAPFLKTNLGGRVYVECHAELERLLRGCPGIDGVFRRGSQLPPCDFQLPLLSLPRWLHPVMPTIPMPTPYLFAEKELIEKWRTRLASHKGFRIGIAWQGSRKYPGDWFRSIRLREFAPLAKVPNVRLISLQKGIGSEQVAAVREQFEVIDISKELDETTGPFIDTAAVLKNLDLVVACDTVLGHLGGALGAPTWIAVPAAPDWRWMLNRDDSPWYPTVRLFRQERLGQWGEVFERMAQLLLRTANRGK